eukprot:6633730-Alexandrium_andersonii.AAC.1
MRSSKLLGGRGRARPSLRLAVIRGEPGRRGELVPQGNGSTHADKRAREAAPVVEEHDLHGGLAKLH